MLLRFLLLCLFAVVRLASAENLKISTTDLDWLKGCWEGGANGTQFAEHWMKPAGQTMLGMSRTVAGGKTVEFEFMQIRQEDDGEIYFIANPSGQKEARFKLINAAAREVVFENPTHDFPQRIIYRSESVDVLLGRIEGTIKGKDKAVDFPMKRTLCD